jgi:hypothetical protein
MNDYTLSSKQIAELEQEHRRLKEKHQADRVKAVIAPGLSHEIILY